VLDFGTAGKLRDSDLVMYDRQTESWWHQLSGEALVGTLAGTKLRQLPGRIVSWRDFRRAHPSGLVTGRPASSASTGRIPTPATTTSRVPRSSRRGTPTTTGCHPKCASSTSRSERTRLTVPFPRAHAEADDHRPNKKGRTRRPLAAARGLGARLIRDRRGSRRRRRLRASRRPAGAVHGARLVRGGCPPARHRDRRLSRTPRRGRRSSPEPLERSCTRLCCCWRPSTAMSCGRLSESLRGDLASKEFPAAHRRHPRQGGCNEESRSQRVPRARRRSTR